MSHKIKDLEKLVKKLNNENKGLIFTLNDYDYGLELSNEVKGMGESFGIFHYYADYEEIPKEQAIKECICFVNGILAGLTINNEKSYIYFKLKEVI